MSGGETPHTAIGARLETNLIRATASLPPPGGVREERVYFFFGPAVFVNVCVCVFVDEEGGAFRRSRPPGSESAPKCGISSDKELEFETSDILTHIY